MSWGSSSGARYDLSPYCGSPPDPAAIWSRWNLDPVLISMLLLVLGVYFAAARRARQDGTPFAAWRRSSFYAGWVLASTALISPLCPLSVSLFSARIAQHMWLTSIAAPLIAVGLPVERRLAPKTRSPLFAAGAFALGLWFWHAPRPYLATFQSDTVYWLMHATLFGAAIWLWRSLLEKPTQRFATVAAATAITTLQMGVLGAVITFASRPLYPVHALTTAAWGLTPLQDQQLGGVIMWVPAGVLIVGALVGGLALAMRDGETRSITAPAA